MNKLKIYRVYYKNGNQKLFEAPSITELVRELSSTTEYNENALVSDITKIEEAKLWRM